MAQKEYLSNAGLEHYDEKIKEYIGDYSSADIVALKEESPATAAHSIGDYITYNHIVYEVTDDINIDDLLIINSNIEVATLAEGTVIYSDDDNGGGGGSSDYNSLTNKPRINNVELSGNKTATDLGLVAAVEGKGLSENDYSDTEKGKVADNASAIEAMVNVTGACNELSYDNSVYSQTIEGITYTVNSDGTISASGTATANGSHLQLWYYQYNTGVEFKDMKISGAPTGATGENDIYIRYRDLSNNIYYYGEGVHDTPSVNAKDIWIGFAPNYAIQGTVTFNPMIHDARLNPTGYVPYSMTNRELTEKQIKTVTESFTTNANSWIAFPNNRIVLNAFIVNESGMDYVTLSIAWDEDNSRYASKLGIENNVASTSSYSALQANHTYSVRYSYIEA